MNNRERIYIADDDEARARGEWRDIDMEAAREDAEGGMRLVAYLVLGVAMMLGGGALLLVLALLAK